MDKEERRDAALEMATDTFARILNGREVMFNFGPKDESDTRYQAVVQLLDLIETDTQHRFHVTFSMFQPSDP